MQLRHDQLARLRNAAALRHEDSILRFLKSHYPNTVAGLSDDLVRERIRWGLNWIRDAGVTRSRAAALFVVTQFAVGPTFHAHPACRTLLADRRIPLDARVLSLFGGAVDIPWAAIGASRDDSAWMTPRAGRQP